jgi:hypothetical protein
MSDDIQFTDDTGFASTEDDLPTTQDADLPTEEGGWPITQPGFGDTQDDRS